MYFSDVFNVSTDLLISENVFDISLVSDLPLFIDPFLIFDSEKPEYQKLHRDVVRYVAFLRDKLLAGQITGSQEREWFHLPEIPNNWLGYAVGSNDGRGLREKFARGASIGLRGPVRDFGNERISKGSHIERLFLFAEGAGRDALSDFITNLCHEYLLIFTQRFTEQYVDDEQCREFDVRHVRFDYSKERWVNGKFVLPVFKTQYVLLTPLDLLTQSVPWINRPDLFDRFGGMLEAVGDSQLRSNVNTFLLQKLAPPPDYPRDKEYNPPKKDVRDAYARALEMYPELANWYVAIREASGADAVHQSMERVSRAENLYRDRVVDFVTKTLQPSGFFEIQTHDTARLLQVFAAAIEENGRALFLGEDGLVRDLTAGEVELVCTLSWRADGNKDRRLPKFRFVSDPKSASSFESGPLSKWQQAGMLVVTTDRARKSRIKLITDDLDGIAVASITGTEEGNTKVESVFISYTKSDESWARWIGSVLISAGYRVTVQYRDFLPGTNFVDQMDRAVKGTDRTIAVLSRSYLESPFATVEWQSAFRDDPLGQKRKLVPIRVEKISPTGLLGSVIYADLCGLSEKSATAVLLGALSAERRPDSSDENAVFPGPLIAADDFERFLEQVPSDLGKRRPTVVDVTRRLQVAANVMSLKTDHVNLLVYALNPPDNEIPPVSAAAKDRAAALLSWCSQQGIDLSVIEDLIKELSE